MYYLNFSQLKLATIKSSITLFCCLFLFACSTTEQVNENYFLDNGYTQGFVTKNFSHNTFTQIDKNTIKKPLYSDHHLMMSLLNRPVTADQAMMVAFAQERERYNSSYSHYAVEIKGDKSTDNSNNRSKHPYADLISQDINAVIISAPH